MGLSGIRLRCASNTYMSIWLRRCQIAFGVLVILCLALWFVTLAFGAKDLCRIYEERSNFLGDYHRVEKSGLTSVQNTYYCEGKTLGPLIVQLDYGESCGSNCGGGAVEVFRWLPGHYHRLYWISAWVR